MFRSIRRGLSNLWTWLPIIWRDRDFDYNFLLRILALKLERMAQHMLAHNLIMDAPEIAGQMWRARYLAQAILDGRVEDCYFDDWEKAWWSWQWVPKPRPGGMLTQYSVAPEDEPSADAMTRAGRAADMAQHGAVVELCQTLMLMERWWD